MGETDTLFFVKNNIFVRHLLDQFETLLKEELLKWENKMTVSLFRAWHRKRYKTPEMVGTLTVPKKHRIQVLQFFQ